VITTDALELGIDVGELDAAVVVTFPGTGRFPAPDVGARGRSSIRDASEDFPVCRGEDALDQFFARHPQSSSSGRWRRRSSTTRAP